MSPTILDKLAEGYLTQQILDGVDHGLEDPRSGGYSIIQDLQADLQSAQRRKQSTDEAAVAIVNRLFETGDLYLSMCNGDGPVTATRDKIQSTESLIETASGIPCTEHYYSTLVTYHINLGLHLLTVGVDPKYHDEAASGLDREVPRYQEYLERMGLRELLDRWLPGSPDDLEYGLSAEVLSVEYKPFARVEMRLKVAERWLVPAI